MLTITAGNVSYFASTAQELVVSQPGVLVNCSDSNGYPMSATLVSGPSGLTLQSDGEVDFTDAAVGQVQAEFKATDGHGGVSNIATITINVELGVSSASDSTKMPVDTIHIGQQILSDPWADAPITSPLPAGGSGGTVISSEPADGARPRPITCRWFTIQWPGTPTRFWRAISAWP